MDSELYDQAKKFRKAFLKIKPENFEFGLLSEYPKNCCEFSSYLLAKYLIEKYNYKNTKMVTGENRYKTIQRHTWLIVNGLDVDITAYQFSSTNKTVITAFSSEWHEI